MKKRRSIILAFVLPFLIVGGLTVWHWYDYGLQDARNARARFAGWEIRQPGDEWEALRFALIFGVVTGSAAGTIGLGIYGITKFVGRKSQPPSL